VNHQTPADPGRVSVGDRGLVAIQALDMKLVLDAAEGIGPWARDALAHAGLACALIKENVEALPSSTPSGRPWCGVRLDGLPRSLS
jgi:hypothetical protein